MRAIIIILSILSFLLTSGCAHTPPSPYPKASRETIGQLYRDLDSGKLQGKTLDYIGYTYGAPESTTNQGQKILIIYRRPAYEDSVYLWFDDGEHLSSWSH